MIRGIILLILSCVVLTLQTNTLPLPCSCEANPGSTIYDQARSSYPMAKLDTVDVTDMPKSGDDIQQFCDTFSQQNYIGTVDTGILSSLLNSVLGECSIVDRLLATITEVLASVRIEIKALGLYIKVRLDDLCIRVSGIYSPLHAFDHCLEVLKLLNRQRSADRCDDYLNIKSDLSGKYSDLLNEKADILRKSVSASKGLDDRMSQCEGGLLGGLLCGKLDMLLGVVNGILRTLLDLILNLLNNLKIHLNLYILDLKAILDVHIGLFSKICDDDLNENLVASEIKRNYAELENGKVATPEDIKQRLTSYMTDQKRMGVMGDIVKFHLGNGYSLSNFQCSCSGLEEGVLGPITCTAGGVLSLLNVDVGLDISINKGGDLLNDILRTLFLAITGSPHCETNVVSIGVDGLVKINVGINLPLIQNVLTPVYDLLGGNLLGCINPQEVDQNVKTIYDNVNSVSGADNIISQMNDQNQIKTDAINQIIAARPSAESDLISRTDADNLQQAQRDSAMDAIKNAGHPVEACQIINQKVVDYKTEVQNDYKAALESIKIDAKLADARVASCTENLCQARLDHMNEPDNADYTQAYEKRCDELKDALALALKVQQQCNELQAKLELQIGSGDQAILALQADLNVCLNDLINSVSHTLASIKIKLALNPQKLLDTLGDILRALLGPDCNIIEGVWSGLENALDVPVLNLQIGNLIAPEKHDYVMDCHRTLIPYAVQLLTGCPVKSCEVTNTNSNKRSLAILDATVDVAVLSVIDVKITLDI